MPPRPLPVRVLRGLAVAALIAWSAFPILLVIVSSLKPPRDIFVYPPRWLFEPTLANYAGLWTRWPDFFRNLANSAIVAAVPSNEDSMVLAVPEPAAAAMNNLRVLYQLSALLGSSFDQDQVLEVVMDLVFEHVKADRGIVLMLDERSGELYPKVVP